MVWGAVAAAAIPIIADKIFGSSKKKKKKGKPVSSLDEKQTSIYNSRVEGLQKGTGEFADLYKYNAEKGNQVFDQNIARPAYRDWQEKTIPGITGSFRGANLQDSTYTGEALARSGRDVQENLDAQRSSFNFQGEQAAMNRREAGINNTLNMQTFATPQAVEGKGSSIDQILGKIAPAAGDWFADWLNTPGTQKASPSGNNWASVAANATRR